VEEGAVLVVGKAVVDLLVPYYPSVRWRNIDELDPECVANRVVRKNGGALQARVGPSVAVGVSDVEASNGDRLDLVGLLRDGPLHGLLVVVGEDGGHVRD
jgi:hypothetical protein